MGENETGVKHTPDILNTEQTQNIQGTIRT